MLENQNLYSFGRALDAERLSYGLLYRVPFTLAITAERLELTIAVQNYLFL
jgi:hypothetical protein